MKNDFGFHKHNDFEVDPYEVICDIQQRLLKNDDMMPQEDLFELQDAVRDYALQIARVYNKVDDLSQKFPYLGYPKNRKTITITINPNRFPQPEYHKLYILERIVRDGKKEYVWHDLDECPNGILCITDGKYHFHGVKMEGPGFMDELLGVRMAENWDWLKTKIKYKFSEDLFPDWD